MLESEPQFRTALDVRIGATIPNFVEYRSKLKRIGNRFRPKACLTDTYYPQGGETRGLALCFFFVSPPVSPPTDHQPTTSRLQQATLDH